MTMTKHKTVAKATVPLSTKTKTTRQQEVLILKGLPGSGKSTYASELQKANPGKYKRVSKDDLRAMIDLGKFSKKKERFVNQIRDAVIGCGIADGFSVIVDDTNLNPVHEKNIRALVSSYNSFVPGDVNVEVIEFDADPEECISRKPHREKAIVSMTKKWLRPEVYEDFICDDCLEHLEPSDTDYLRIVEEALDNLLAQLQDLKKPNAPKA